MQCTVDLHYFESEVPTLSGVKQNIVRENWSSVAKHCTTVSKPGQQRGARGFYRNTGGQRRWRDSIAINI